MEIFVVFKTYRQKDGEYFAIQVEQAFANKTDAEVFIKDKPTQWWETKDVPLSNGGGTTPIEFLGLRSVHPTELTGL